MTKPERELLIQLLVNVDEITDMLTPDQLKLANKSIRKIYGNYHNLLEGVGND